MGAKIIDGKEIAAQVYEDIKKDIEQLKKKNNITPGIAVVLVGNDPASKVYVNSKKKMCDKLGIYSEEYRLMATAREEEVLSLIDDLNNNPSIHGILVQLPLPEGIDSKKVIKAISVSKDVDGFHPESVGNLLVGDQKFVSCTPLGVQQLFIRSGIDVAGSNVVIIGRSNIVGKPLAALLMQKKQGANATVTVCHSRSKNLKEITKNADILIAAIGRAEFVTADMVKEGAVVIDVGMNRVDAPDRPKGYRLVGDVAFDTVSEKASFITKVPGGVGPMTIAMLMYNTIQAAKNSVEES